MGSKLSANSMAPWEAQSNSRLSLIFRPGQRPSAAAVLRLAESSVGSAREQHRRDGLVPGFAVTHQPEPSAGWLELLAGGLTFDLAGLAPAASAPMPTMAHFYGFPERPGPEPAEAITLMPGEQLRGGESLLPVMRTMAGLATRLAALSEVTAVVWHPARCAMAPAVFASAIGRWLAGGAFPSLGLTALFRDGDGAICSEGLAFFIGQELRIDPIISINTEQKAKIAARLINQLVGSDPIHQPFEFIGPNGEKLSVEPSGNDGFLRVWRKT
jgi:hypothetical protein